MAGTSFDINNGANQIAPNAMTQNQYFYGEEFARKKYWEARISHLVW